MLVTFSAAGYASISEPVVLRFVPSEHARIKGTRYEKSFHVLDDYKLMRSALLFGPNSSGKTNILRALQQTLQIVFNGLALPRRDDRQGMQTSFHIGLIDQNRNNEYEYAVTYDHSRVLQESLAVNGETAYCYEKDRLVCLQQPNLSVVTPSRDILSQLSQHLPAVAAFRSAAAGIHLVLEEDLVQLPGIPFLISPEEEQYWQIHRELVLSLLRVMDATVCDIFLNKEDTLSYSVHLVRCGQEKSFPLADEAAGIRKMAALASVFIAMLKDGDTLILDQLEQSWATPVLLALVRDFIHTDNNCGQFVAVTHDLFLLDNNLFQPEQLYLVRKNLAGFTALWSVGDFHLRSEKRRLYDEYLKGTFDKQPE